jgi:hypothetical protein
VPRALPQRPLARPEPLAERAERVGVWVQQLVVRSGELAVARMPYTVRALEDVADLQPATLAYSDARNRSARPACLRAFFDNCIVVRRCPDVVFGYLDRRGWPTSGMTAS